MKKAELESEQEVANATKKLEEVAKKVQAIEIEAGNNALTDVKIKVTCLMLAGEDFLYHSELIGTYGQVIETSDWRSRGASGKGAKDLVIQQAREVATQNGYVVVGEPIIEVI